MRRCPNCGSIFTLYFDRNECAWCSNCNNFCTTRMGKVDEVETAETEERTTAIEIEFARSKRSK